MKAANLEDSESGIALKGADRDNSFFRVEGRANLLFFPVARVDGDEEAEAFIEVGGRDRLVFGPLMMETREHGDYAVAGDLLPEDQMLSLKGFLVDSRCHFEMM